MNEMIASNKNATLPTGDTSTINKSVSLPMGGTLELQMTAMFIASVRKHFSLDDAEELTDDHLRMFVHGSVKNALDKVQNGQ